MKKPNLPATISVVILGAAASGCGTTPLPSPGDGGMDAGVCPPGCFNPKQADGGPYRSQDGGIECFC